MKNAKRWLAILLAVTLLCSNGVSQLGMIVSASELETTEEAQPKEDAVVEQAEETKEDTGKATVEGVTPEEERGESSAQDAETANVPKAAAQEGAQEGQNEANVPEADPAAVVPVTANPATGAPATAAPVSEGAAPAEEAPAPEVQTYNVKINKSELGGGQIKVWGSDNNKVDVTEYDGNNQYVKEVKEGEEFNFQITLNDGFEIAQVKVNGNALDPANTEGNVITYKVAGINEEKVIDVTYNKVETPAEEKAAEEPKTEDETKVEEPAVENPTASAAVTATGEIMTDFYVKADRSSVTVGDTVNVKAIIKPDEFSDKRVTWESSDETIATVDENGLVTTRAIGTVRITGKSEANPDMTDFDIITVNPIQVSKITITGYAKEYMLPNETVKLDATVEPDNAADKSVIWTSSDETIATVDQNGNVNALKQGEVTIRVAANDASGKYAEQKIKVYDAKPQEATVQVWVTNQYRGISYTINIPADGTEVNASDVIQKVDGYVSTNIIRVGTWESGSTWSTIQKTNPVQKFRYNNNRIQYTTNGYSWSNVSSNKIVAFYAIKTTAELGNTDVGVAVGDWPYGPGEATSHTKQTIRIKIVVDGSNNEIYNSGLLRYDNRSNGEYGKIEFDCDESRYEIKEILVYKNDSGTGKPLKTYTSVPTGGISVKFTDGGTNHYLVKAVVKPKEFDVTYDINGGEGKVPASTKLTAVDGQQVTVATSPQPTKEGYIFAGWEYDGTTYYGGESFEMPPHNVTFKAKWLKTSGVITYSSNNEEWGTVSRSYETLKDGSTETRGSVAKANEGCVFAGWKNNQTGEIVSNELIYKPIAEPGSYTAVFKANINKYLELKTNDVTAKYDGKDYATGTATVKDKATGKVADDVTIKYQKADGSWTTNPSEITATNVSDSKTVQVRATSEKYTGELIGTEKLTITPKPVTVTANSYNKAYGATDPEFTAKVEGTLGSDTVNYKLNRETGEDVGTYKILAIGDAAQGNYSVTYYPGTLTITAATRPEDRQLGVTSYEGVYDANEHTITVDNVLDGDVVEYSYDGGETWTTNLNQYKDVTETTIKVRVTNVNYDPSPVELEGTVKITPKPVTVTANSYNKAYGATDPTFTAKVEGTLGTDAVNYILNRETGENVGTYKILAIGDATQGNYSVTYYPGTLTITASTRPEDKQLGVTSYEGVYDANNHTITVNNVLDGDVVEYSYDGGETWTTNLNQYKDVTETTIKVRVTNANYDPNPVELEGTVKITPKPVTVTANSDSKTYGAADPEFTATVVGTLGTDKVTYNLSREAGEDVGTYPITASGDATQGNYNVTYHPGTLTITAATRPEDKQLSVTSYEGVYDANNHTITVNNVLDGDVVEYSYDGGETWTTNLNQYKDVTETTIKVRVTNANYDPNPVELEGTVKITPKPVTVTANSDSKTYGASDPEFTATVEGTLGTDKVTYNLSREAGEDVGTYPITASGDATQGNYSVSYNPGTLTIVASDREKAVEVASYNGVYDAKKHTIEVKNLERGDLVKYSYDNGTTWEDELKEYTDVTAGTTILVQVMNDNYAEVPKLTGTVTITPKPVTVTANSDSKTYGAADPEFTAIVVGTLGTDKVTYNLSREAGEDVGTYSITASGDATQGNYNVTYHPGTLTITAATRPEDRQLGVTSYEGVYDANEHTITVDNVLDGDVVEYSYDGGETWTTNLNQYKDVTETTIKVRVTNANYDPSPVELEGTVKITPKPVTVTANSYNKAYGATDPTFTAKVEGTLGTDAVNYILNRETGENVGTYKILAIGDATQGNYSVTYYPGTLTITASTRPEDKQLSVTSYEGVYDANDHTITVNNVLNGDVVEYSYDGGETWKANLNQYKDVTETTIKVRVTNANYDPSPVELEGTVKITPKPVTVTANSDSKTYGAADPEFTATVVGTLGTDKVTYNLSREAGEDVGTYPITASGDATQGNYNVTYHPGTLTITASTRPEDKQLSVTSYEGVYDANDHTITVNNVLDGDVVEYSYDGGETWKANLNQYKDVTETTIKVRVTNANYDPSPVELEGTVKITPKPVTVTANSYNKAYGATDSTFTAKVEGTLGTDKVTYNLSREAGEDVGTYPITASGDATQGNYSVTYYPGTLTITAATRPEDKQLSVTSYEGVYDANNHTITVNNVLDGDVVEYSYDGGETWTTNLNQYKDVTETTIKVRVTNANYDPNPVELEGTVKITPKPVTVTANSDSKTYGASDPEFTATVEGTLGSDTVSYKLNRETGEDVGTYKILAIGDATQGNYSVTYYPGKLTITAATRPEDKQLSVTSYEGVYDANDHTITVDNVLDGDVVEYSYDGGETWKANLNQYKDVTETTIKVRVTNANYDPNPVELEGTVKITPATLTVSTPTDTKVYEGTPLTAAGTINGFVNGETATFTTTGSQTEVGSTANTYSLTWDGTAKESNYTVAEAIGTLTVTAQSIDPDNPNYKGITVDAPTDVEYTGADQTWLPTVTDGNGKALVKDTDYTVTYDNEDRTNVTGTITVTINGAGNYAGTITREYQITPKPVTITTESKTKAFDGTALTAGGKVEGIVSGETYGFEVTGSQTYVGSSQNTYEMVWADSEVEGTSGTYTAKKTNYTVTESIGTLAVTAGTPENPLDPTLVVNKTHDKSQTYKAGDVITFTITAKNIYEEAKTITLEELEGVALDANVFENVAPGAEVTATATYTVTEQDIVNGTFTNNVTVTFSGVDDKFTGTDTVDELEDANPHMTITKTTVGADAGHIYKLGEVINYKITATNDGNLTLTNVKVEDALTGNVGENAFTIDTLAPGEAQTFDVRYVVTENDVLAGKVINNATGTATDPTDPDEPKTPVTPGEKEDPIETPNPSLAVVKTSDKTGVVKLGETITYTITVTNNGNVTINDIEVTDELTGNTGDNAFTIDRLAVGETKQFTATYTVTEDDILEGTIVNRATATGKDPRNEEVTGDGEVRVDTEEKDDSKKDDSKKDDSKKDDSKKNDSDKKPGAVKTGDATDVIPFFGMTVLAAGAAIVIALKKKRRA